MVMITIIPETVPGVFQHSQLILNGNDNSRPSRLGIFKIYVYVVIKLVKQLHPLHDQLQAPRFVCFNGFLPVLYLPFPSNTIVHDFANKRITVLLKPNGDPPRPLFWQNAMFDGVFHKWLQ